MCTNILLNLPNVFLILLNLPQYAFIYITQFSLVSWSVFCCCNTPQDRLSYKKENLEDCSEGWLSKNMVPACAWPLVRALCCSPYGGEWEKEQVGADGGREGWTACWLTCSWPSKVVLIGLDTELTHSQKFVL